MSTANISFANRIIVVTGASRGIGAAIAAALASRGATVVANYPELDCDLHRAAIDAWRIDANIPEKHVVPVMADVGDVDAVNGLYTMVRERWGHLDVLVNNAGINRDSTVAKMSDEQWRQVLAINLDGTFYNCRAASGLLNDGGRIVNMASVVAHTGNFGVANYAASKAGILGLTRSLALEMARRQITVNAVCPGFIDTDMTRRMPPDVLAAVEERIPMRRLGETADIVHCVMFLASPDARYITGQAIGVNGGIYMGA